MNDLTLDRPSRRKRQRSRAELQNVTSITQKAVTALVLLASFGLVFAGLRMAGAGFASYQAEAFLQDWAGKGAEPSAEAWQVAQGAAQRAVSLYPVANGEYFDRLGRVYSWQQFKLPYGSPDALSSRLAALDAYRASLEARPVWPNTWARLANTKLHLALFDDEFKQALERASALGPSRIEVQREVTMIVFAAWAQLSKQERASFLESARRSVTYGQREAQQIQLLAAQHGLTGVLCNSLDDETKSIRKLCQ
ncbi:hypothetical protein [Stutzerimonas xanthomarina]|uniref:hypothetical protein n=1 Tax=Stutzerimonas xanthomarina TaxID=271420 RepID=UPI003AA97F3B